MYLRNTLYHEKEIQISVDCRHLDVGQGRISVMLRARSAVWPGHGHEPYTVATFGMSTQDRLLEFSMPSDVASEGGVAMDPIYTNVAGLDVHSRSIQICLRRVQANGRIRQQVRSFNTVTRDILALADWLTDEQVTHVAMESTGVYWKPIYNLLEGRFTLLLVNAKHVKNVPGRKTDVKDCQWLAQLLQCGLLQASFVPQRPQRELRDLTRLRAQLVGQRASVTNRIHKTLEDANIKFGTVVSDILGVSGRDMLRALIAGQKNAEEMAELARRQMRGKIPELRLALEGKMTEHHRFVLQELLDQLEDLERRIERFDQRIEQVSGPFEVAITAVAQLRASVGVRQPM
jgi:transposase